jgi:hypothetical protein
MKTNTNDLTKGLFGEIARSFVDLFGNIHEIPKQESAGIDRNDIEKTRKEID